MIKIMKSGETPASELFARTASARDVSGTVAEIIANVRANGDAALCDCLLYTSPSPRDTR